MQQTPGQPPQWQPPAGYGPPAGSAPSYSSPQGYGSPQPPPKKGMSAARIATITRAKALFEAPKREIKGGGPQKTASRGLGFGGVIFSAHRSSRVKRKIATRRRSARTSRRAKRRATRSGCQATGSPELRASVLRPGWLGLSQAGTLLVKGEISC